MSFNLLSEPIRKYVRDKKWEQLKPIQAAAIERILTTEDNYILASRTASGKTEAAFLPVLSAANFNAPGIKVLYISPLIALINDQFLRVEELCKNLEVPVTKWHGEANKSLKDQLLKDPSGVMLITPESIEAMFVNKPFNVIRLFSGLEFVVIDEIHSFLGTDRGIQLKSLLSRLQTVNRHYFRVIGLSATIGDYELAKTFAGPSRKTTVLLDKTPKEVKVSFRYFSGGTDELPLALLKNLYLETKDNKALIFPNSRGRAEEVAVKLKKISQKVNGHPNYFSHHSSVDRDEREYVEYFAKNNTLHNFCIACTSTLELGIDIGTVDEVVQIDASHSIASLVQRLGRSGRRDGAASTLVLYATGPWSLLQSMACWLLYREGFIEPPAESSKPYDLLAQQALSIVKGTSGIAPDQLIAQLKGNYAFAAIAENEILPIINHLIDTDMLERLGRELIIGVTGEKVVNNKDFYSAFTTEEHFKVVHAGNRIGEIPYTPQVLVDQNIMLAAKIWKIRDIDFKAKKIEVAVAKDGKKPIFLGLPGNVHAKVRQKMLEIIYTGDCYDFLDEASVDELKVIRSDFRAVPIEDPTVQRPLIDTGNKLQLFAFTSTKINNTIALLFHIKGIPSQFNPPTDSFEVVLGYTDFMAQWRSLPETISAIDGYLSAQAETNPEKSEVTKWAFLLPLPLRIAIAKEKVYDIEGTRAFLETVTFLAAQQTEGNQAPFSSMDQLPGKA
ncbi:DEAD/DEAH box helicase [Taibaiella chishuiensis]|uniref:ATP-dependent Lhr-like helicase n=1 Tax=Taibaiella chishuiensis TaxID=1434707 RepID=A0A2P8CV64_9BACT|nr:DEAD/DEAH box helicase [Taibaiella chishuiensis]PSK88861.1 ATP-dependent Lhr-like helicase [Taibaiella chishuiensis]